MISLGPSICLTQDTREAQLLSCLLLLLVALLLCCLFSSSYPRYALTCSISFPTILIARLSAS
jgi:hypothetical protein